MAIRGGFQLCAVMQWWSFQEDAGGDGGGGDAYRDGGRYRNEARVWNPNSRESGNSQP